MKKGKVFAWLIPTLAVFAAGVVFVVIYANTVYYNEKVSEAYLIKFTKAVVEVGMSQNVQLEPSLECINSNMKKRTARRVRESQFTYVSSNTDIATVDETGMVAPVSPGMCVVTIEFDDLTLDVPVHVYLEVSSITFDSQSLLLNVGDTKTLHAVMTPAEAHYKMNPSFQSLDLSVCTVSEDGTVTAVGPGKTGIVLTDGDFTDTCEIEVLAPLESIRFSAEEYTVIIGESVPLPLLYEPYYTTDDRTAVYSIEDESIGTIDEEGKFKALYGGETTVTARVGECLATCTVHVEVPMTGISFSVSDLSIRIGDSFKLPVKINPSDTTEDRTITFTSSDPAAVTVDENGNAKAVSPGNAVITASALDGKFTATMSIRVLVPVTKVQLSTYQLTMNKGTEKTLSASLYPSYTTEEKYIQWASDNINVVKVVNGKLTAVGAGTAHVTAYHDDIAAVCTVTVKSPITGIEFEQKSFTLIETFSVPLAVTFLPADTTDPKTASFSTDNKEIAVIQDGKLVAKKAGTCNVIAKDAYGHTATATVTVTPYIYVQSVSVNPTEISFEHQGETYQLSATVSPANAIDQNVTYSSSDSAIATVSETGLVKGISEGTCTITASCGGKSANVTVSVPAADIIVVLDPGHDGTHTGAISHYTATTVHEEVITLQTAKACKAYLESNYIGVKVYLTRNDAGCPKQNLPDYPNQITGSDKAIDLQKRVLYAQELGATLFVSLHYNDESLHSRLEEYRASYCCTFISKQANIYQQSLDLSKSILKYISALGIKSEGPKVWNSSDYFDEFGNPMDYNAINRHAAACGIPGIIVEHCFMTGDYDMVSDPETIEAFGIADAKGIAEYLKLEKKE